MVPQTDSNEPLENEQSQEGDPLAELKQISMEDWIWLAAILEGEGHFSSDNRSRSTSNSPDYVPPPSAPFIKLEHTQHETALRVGAIVGQNVNLQNRRTVTGLPVWRVTVCSRAKTEYVLKKIYPLISGERTKQKIEGQLLLCDQYNLWLAEGGRKKAAQLANKASQLANRARQQRRNTN
jgi:hypothetical protein